MSRTLPFPTAEVVEPATLRRTLETRLVDGRSSHELDEEADSYDGLRDRAQLAAAAGELETAERLLGRAEELARESGDRHQISMAVCNRAAVAIELGQAREMRSVLRAVLADSPGEVPNTLAAYHLGRTFELDKDFKKALFYARLARDHALACDVPEYRASAFNLLGNVLLAECEVGPATEAYERALSLMPEGDTLRRARVLDNLGYCRALEGRFGQAFPLLYESLRTLRRCGAWAYCTSTHLDLCFAHLETARLRDARRHGERALALAEQFDDQDSVRNALYLLGEVAEQEGDEGAAFAAFEQLQRRFYPDDRGVLHLLMAVDMRAMVNLRA